ncbi:MAG: metal ABC transporter permease, partial [Candidatus Paceibacterales bacterium]
MFEIFHYSFMVRAFIAGGAIALIAPLIGTFLVVKRFSLFADSLSHVALAGVAIGLLLKINPLITATIAAVVSSVAIERLRLSKKVYGESALAIFLSGSLAIAIVLISLAHGFSVDIFNYLFGSIVTVKDSDIKIIASLAGIVTILVVAFYKELVFTSFDEEAAQVAGIKIKFINILLIVLAALTVAVAIPIVGVLLIA